jgi:hypothetical protein
MRASKAGMMPPNASPGLTSPAVLAPITVTPPGVPSPVQTACRVPVRTRRAPPATVPRPLWRPAPPSELRPPGRTAMRHQDGLPRRHGSRPAGSAGCGKTSLSNRHRSDSLRP